MEAGRRIHGWKAEDIVTHARRCFFSEEEIKNRRGNSSNCRSGMSEGPDPEPRDFPDAQLRI